MNNANNISIRSDSNTNGPSDSGNNTNLLYQKNYKTNKEKFQFWKFLMYGTKAEVHINEFYGLLYWVSIMELALFILGLILFFGSPKTFSVFWVFVTHVIRAILGLLLLKRLPCTYQVIEELKEYENSSIEDVENQIIQLYKNLLSNNESRIRPVLIWYFVFTIIDIIIDNIIFFFLLQQWNNSLYGLQNIISLIMIVAFFSNNK